MAMKALEMDKGLDEATKALAYSAYLQALADAVLSSTPKEEQKAAQIHADTLTEEQRQILRDMKKQDLVELYNAESKRLSPCKWLYHQVNYERLTKPQIIALFAFLPKRYAVAQ